MTLPFSVVGTLGMPSVDFFRFTATPNSVIVVDHEGADTGQGTLQDPLLGLYDSSCTLLRTNDDSGSSLNSRLGFVVPADGVFILAASSCCDSDFTLPRTPRITPRLNRTTFTTGDTLVLALDVQNASPAAANVRIVATALVPGEPGINRASFCCFQDAVTLFEDPSVSIPALTSTTVPNVVSYQFNGSEPAGPYSVCVSQAHGRVISQPCATFTVTP